MEVLPAPVRSRSEVNSIMSSRLLLIGSLSYYPTVTSSVETDAGNMLLMPVMLVSMIHQTSCIPVTSDVDPRDLGTHIIPGPGVLSTRLAGSLHPTLDIMYPCD